MDELSAETAVSAGGWDARYAVALAVTSHGGMAAALIDTNGDGVDIDLDQYERGADGHWQETGSGNAGNAGASWTPQIAATWGRAEPRTRVDVDTSAIGTRSSHRRRVGGCSSGRRRKTLAHFLNRSTAVRSRPDLPDGADEVPCGGCFARLWRRASGVDYSALAIRMETRRGVVGPGRFLKPTV
jgi:hypothetical protein